MLPDVSAGGADCETEDAEEVTASLLPLPYDPRFPALVELWPAWAAMGVLRSVWLREFETLLREFYPQANSASRKLTARHYAPFPLAAGHDVP